MSATNLKGRAASKQETGLIGLFGHTYIDHERYDGKAIQYQFLVIRQMPPDKWVVQLYSFMDGSPNVLKVYSESFPLSEGVKLYPDADTWNEAYQKWSDDCNRRREW